MKPRLDVLGLGCTAVDEILYVPAYPPADAKVEVRQRERHCGGLTATALVAASRLGSKAAFAGTLGSDPESQFVLHTFAQEKVNTRHVVHRDGAGPVRSVIVVDETHRTRNIFYNTQHAFGAHSTKPHARVIESARVLLVDRFGIPGMIRATTIARAAGIPVVADFESSHMPRFAKLLALVDHPILSEKFACRITRTQTAAAAAKALWNENRNVVVITCGARGCWYLAEDQSAPRHLPAFAVKAVDTTGCGDVFHGAYAAALARGMDLIDRLRWASAAAALKATKHGGQAGIPNAIQVRRFLASQR